MKAVVIDKITTTGNAALREIEPGHYAACWQVSGL